MRPKELCSIRPADIDRSGEVWMYRPDEHKTARHGIEKAVPIVGDAREALTDYLTALAVSILPSVASAPLLPFAVQDDEDYYRYRIPPRHYRGHFGCCMDCDPLAVADYVRRCRRITMTMSPGRRTTAARKAVSAATKSLSTVASQSWADDFTALGHSAQARQQIVLLDLNDELAKLAEAIDDARNQISSVQTKCNFMR